MSMHNLRNCPFAILNERGYYDIFDSKGNFMDFKIETIRITQKAGMPDKILLIGPINVVQSYEEIENLLESWSL